MKRLLIWSLGGFTIGCIIYKTEHINKIFTPPQLSEKYLRYAEPNTICHGKIIGECLRGDLKSEHEILVLGDSHAAMLNKFFDVIGNDAGFKARVITASSCVTIPSFDYQRLPYWARKPCLSQIEKTKIYYEENKYIILAGAWNYQFSNPDFPHVLLSFLDDAQKRGEKVVILAQVPLLNKNPLRSLRFQYIGIPTKIGINMDYIKTNEISRNFFRNL